MRPWWSLTSGGLMMVFKVMINFVQNRSLSNPSSSNSSDSFEKYLCPDSIGGPSSVSEESVLSDELALACRLSLRGHSVWTLRVWGNDDRRGDVTSVNVGNLESDWETGRPTRWVKQDSTLSRCTARREISDIIRYMKSNSPTSAPTCRGPLF